MNQHEDTHGGTTRPWGPWTTLVLGFLIMGLTFALSMTTFFLFFLDYDAPAGTARYDGRLVALSALVSAPILLLLTVLAVLLRKGPSVRDYLGLCAVAGGKVLRWSGLLLVFLAAAEILAVGFRRPVIPDFMKEAYGTADSPALLLISLVIAAPLSEEIFFRGFLLAGFRHSRLGNIGAVAVASLLWSLTHIQYDFYDMFWIFVLGLILGLARIRTGSVYTPTVMHATVNSMAFVITALYVD